MSVKLPKEITIKIDSPTEIHLSADGVEFPFDISSLKISYTPEGGFFYGISAGYGELKEIPIQAPQDEPYRKNANSVLSSNNDLLAPSKLGVVPMDEDDDDELVEKDIDRKNLGAMAIKILNETFPERLEKVVENAPRGWNEYKLIRVDTVSKTVETDDDIRDLLVELGEAEKDAFESYEADGIKKKYTPIQLPTLIWEDDGSAYVEERFRVYEK